MSRKPGQESTKLYAQLVKLTDLATTHQQAIEELTGKVILLAQNLNVLTFRLAVTERILKTRLSITPEEIERCGLEALEQDRQQRAEALEKEQKELEAHQQTGGVTTTEAVQTALAAGVAAPPASHLRSIPATPQMQ